MLTPRAKRSPRVILDTDLARRTGIISAQNVSRLARKRSAARMTNAKRAAPRSCSVVAPITRANARRVTDPRERAGRARSDSRRRAGRRPDRADELGAQVAASARRSAPGGKRFYRPAPSAPRRGARLFLLYRHVRREQDRRRGDRWQAEGARESRWIHGRGDPPGDRRNAQRLLYPLRQRMARVSRHGIPSSRHLHPS